MFFRNKQVNNSNGYNNRTVYHTEDDEVTIETSINNTERPFQLVKPLITFFIMSITLHQLWLNYDTFKSYMFRLRSVIFPVVATADDDVPIFGPLDFDTEVSNPIDPIRLIIFILLCLAMTVLFLI